MYFHVSEPRCLWLPNPSSQDRRRVAWGVWQNLWDFPQPPRRPPGPSSWWTSSVLTSMQSGIQAWGALLEPEGSPFCLVPSLILLGCSAKL